VKPPTVLNVELTERTQHPVAVDVRPTLTKVVCCGQLEAGFFTANTVRLVGMPVGVRHGLVGPSERLPDPRRTARRWVGTLTTCPVTLISRQAEHAWPLADTWQPLCTNVQIVSTTLMLLKRVKHFIITITLKFQQFTNVHQTPNFSWQKTSQCEPFNNIMAIMGKNSNVITTFRTLSTPAFSNFHNSPHHM